MDIVVNGWAVLVAAIVGFAIGGLWYSPVMFQKRWVKLSGASMDSVHKGSLSPMQAMGIEFIVILLTSYILAHFAVIAGAHTVSSALQLGFWLWLGFQAPMLLASTLFERKPFELFLINAIQRLVAILVMALIVGLWM